MSDDPGIAGVRLLDDGRWLPFITDTEGSEIWRGLPSHYKASAQRDAVEEWKKRRNQVDA